mmetsp:Transcript_47989/g.112117  ORF Transcript_47989/g.112117 Transcript_47989/m.112117 type:complete len:295 (+) Transcript_47989:13-897(+)
MALPWRLTTVFIHVLWKGWALNFAPVKIAQETALVGGHVGNPAVIIVPELLRVTEQVKQHASRIADEGQFRVLLLDLYKGRMGHKDIDPNALAERISLEGAVNAISEAAEYLKSEKSAKVGLVGFCEGGAIPFAGLATAADICCGVVFLSNGALFGVSPETLDVKSLAAKPVQGHYGALDAAGNADGTTAYLLEKNLRSAGNADATMYVYETVGQSFMNDNPHPFDSFEKRQQELGYPPYDEEQASAAWERLFAFLGWHLAGRLPPTEDGVQESLQMEGIAEADDSKPMRPDEL